MRTRIWIVSISLAGALAATEGGVLALQTPTYGVSVKASKPAALAKARTYSWTESQPSFDKDINRQIVEAVDRELQARGLTKVTSGKSDLVVTYGSLSRTDVDLKAKTAKGEMPPQIPVGTLVVDVRDSANKASLFKVRTDKPIGSTPTQLAADISAAVKAMFEKYPGAAKP